MLSRDVVHAAHDFEVVSFHVLALHNDSQKLWLRFCVFCDIYKFTFDLFFSQDELIQVEAGNFHTGTTVIQQKLPHQFKMYSLGNQTMITPDNSIRN